MIENQIDTYYNGYHFNTFNHFPDNKNHFNVLNSYKLPMNYIKPLQELYLPHELKAIPSLIPPNYFIIKSQSLRYRVLF